MSFDSAWSPPTQAYEKLVDLGFSVRAYYYECGMGFCGIWDEGFDDYYEISGESADEVAEMLPEVLDEMFCISENIRDIERQRKRESERERERLNENE